MTHSLLTTQQQSVVTQLVSARSRRAGDVLRLLRNYADALNQPTSFTAGLGLQASDFAVAQWVWTEKKTQRPDSMPGDDDRRRPREARNELDAIVAPVYEIIGEGEEKLWAEVARETRARLLLLGAPGQGKTFTTQMTVWRVLEESRRALANQTLTPDQLPVAVWLTATDLAEARSNNLSDAVLEVLQKSGNQYSFAANEIGAEWLRKRLRDPASLLVVDSLDETPHKLIHAFKQKSQWFQDFAGRVVVTCRTLNWERDTAYREMMPEGQPFRTVELAPFKPEQQHEFVAGFFREEAPRKRLSAILEHNYALRHASGTPLLLTLICRACADGTVNEKTRYAELYGIVTRRLFSGAWRNNHHPSWRGKDYLQDGYLEATARVIWELFRQTPDINRFSGKQWRHAEAAAQTKAGPLWRPLPADFLDDLEKTGLLVKAGDGGPAVSYSLSHRSLLEYLAAYGLAETPDPLATIYDHLWFEADWVEVSKFLFGLVEDVTPLLERLEAEADDPFDWKIFLQARVAGYGRGVANAAAERIAARLDGLLRQYIAKPIITYTL